MHRAVAIFFVLCVGAAALRPRAVGLRRVAAPRARAPKTMDEWKEFRRKEGAPSAAAKKATELDRRAERWAAAVGASVDALAGFSPARRESFLDEWELENPPPPPPAAPAAHELTESSAEVDVSWEKRVQFEALRDGNALRQNDILGDALKREGGGG